ncbi:hypothetical protein [Streptomyces cinnamoneus]|uniref:HTTM domain-containing protein n=1 Tax=Streptomyces cinnamoneus TaxID=53446 RepID=A0A918WIY2_STRCJ|nr:hypothetical protein [Streptomyces cinnamoneus]GHC47401.1 hypothetical protein GCM10010507_23670 [Streptomyces cinnamoneus]
MTAAPGPPAPASALHEQLLGRLQEMALAQPDAPERLAMCRFTTGMAVLRTVWHLPPGSFFAEYAPLLDQAEQQDAPRRVLAPAAYELLRAVTTLSVGAWTLGVDSPAVRALANLSFWALQQYVVEFHEDLWSYNSHLNLFLAALSLTPPGRDRRVDSALLLALQAYYAMVYLQSGVSKFVGAGRRWADGRTLRAAWGELGTPLGKWLARRDLRLSGALSALTLLFELGFAPALVAAWPQRALLGGASAAFHLAVKATMGISFWHLSWFAAPLFSAPPALGRRLASALYQPPPFVRQGEPCPKN